MNSADHEELLALREKHWHSTTDASHKTSESGWFILINSNYVPTSPTDHANTVSKLRKFMREEFFPNINSFITFNNTSRRIHDWSPEYIDEVTCKFVIEAGRGRILKNGGVGGSGKGKMHLHIDLRVLHHSNISISQQAIYQVAEPFFMYEFGKNPFVAKPRLLNRDRILEYMTKSEIYDEGIAWITM